MAAESNVVGEDKQLANVDVMKWIMLICCFLALKRLVFNS